MCEENKKLENLEKPENTELTDEQMENISGGGAGSITSSNDAIRIDGQYISC